MKTAILVTGLVLLLVANLVMVYYAPYGVSPMEGFQVAAAPPAVNSSANTTVTASAPAPSAPAPMAPATNSGTEGFQNGAGSKYYLENAGGASEKYEPIGAYDGVRLKTGNASAWRYTAPNEPLMGPAFEPGPDSLFMFKNNQCKPECCGASFSCGGGCVCTTPEQRQYIAARGGNRTQPEDSA